MNPNSDYELTRADVTALLTKDEMADWLNVCVKTIDNWLLEGWMPVIQPSPRIQRFNPVHILAAMEQLHGRGQGYQEKYRRRDSIDSVR